MRWFERRGRRSGVTLSADKASVIHPLWHAGSPGLRLSCAARTTCLEDTHAVPLTPALTGGSRTRTRDPEEALRTRGATTPGARLVEARASAQHHAGQGETAM